MEEIRCQNCQGAIGPDQKFCSECGFKIQTAGSNEFAEEAKPGSTIGHQDRSIPVMIPIGISLGLVALIIGVSVGLTSLEGTEAPQAESSSQEVTTTENDFSDLEFPLKGGDGEIIDTTDDWVPIGYKALTSSVAYESISPSEMNCGYSSAHSCYQAYFTSNISCQVFVDVSFMVDGVKVDTAVDSGFLDPGTGSLLTFVSFESARYSGDKNVRIEEVSCY